MKKIQEKYKKSKLLFIIKAILTLTTMYFAIRVVYVSILGLLNSTVLPDKIMSLLFGMLLFLGLSSLMNVIEMMIYNKRKYLVLQLVTTVFILGVAMFVSMG